MLRALLALIGGIVIGGICVGAVEAIGHSIFPPPPGIDVSKPETLRNIMNVIPFGAKVAVLVAWAIGTFAGSTAAILFSGRQSWPAWIVAAFLFGGALWSMLQIAHPDWMVISATIITLVCAILPAYIWAKS